MATRRKSKRNPPQRKPKLTQGWKDPWKLNLPGYEILWDLHQSLREEIEKRWHRGLPFNEELFDRWERARFFGFGEESSIYDSSLVVGEVKVGEHTWIGPFTVLDGSGGLEIGSYCSISAGVHIYTHNTVAWSITGGKASYEISPVRIGDFCYIGPHAVISQGVRIGPNSIVATNSFVNKNVPPRTMVAGNPARTIGSVVIKGRKLIIKKA
jgi:acetyltransferase-like isoleucine patch superfamily enzyme